MMPLVLAVALGLQALVPQQRPTNARDSAQATSRQAITDIGAGVADVRTAHELLRRAAFNGSDAQVVARAGELQQRCRDLAAAARSATRKLCPSCWGAYAQRAIDGYRTVGLQAVGQVGARCAGQLTRDLRERNAGTAVRAGIHALSQALIDGLRPYEAKLLEVRRSFGLVTTPGALPPRTR